MFLFESQTKSRGSRSPRVCGDVSSRDAYHGEQDWFSPRMRGCFYEAHEESSHEKVLPAYAGMFPCCSYET